MSSSCIKPNYGTLNIIALAIFIVNFFFGVHLHYNIVKWYAKHANSIATEAGIRREELALSEKNIVSRNVVQETIRFLKYDLWFALYLIVSMASIGLGFYISFLPDMCKEPVRLDFGSWCLSVPLLALLETSSVSLSLSLSLYFFSVLYPSFPPFIFSTFLNIPTCDFFYYRVESQGNQQLW